MNWIYLLDLIGVFAFATSGVLTAIDNKFDPVGAITIGIATAVGGGTLRDIMIGQTPVSWLTDTNYLWIILTAVLTSYLFKSRIQKVRRSLFFFDTIGIGLFTIIGLEKTVNAGLDLPIAVLMGVITAVFGGVIRDVLTNVIPLIFRKEIYASACLIGAIAYAILLHFDIIPHFRLQIGMLIIVLIRYLSVKYNWSLNRIFRININQ